MRHKYSNYNIELCVDIIDYEKAFDSIETLAVLNCVINYKIDSMYIR